MSVASPYLYCTEQDLYNRLSSEGVLSLLDDDNDGQVDQLEQSALADVLSDASETIAFYTWMKYDPGLLTASAWVNRRAVDLAAWILFQRRGLTPPASVQHKAEQAQKWLEDIADGPRLIPAAPLRRRLAPVWSNTRVDVGFTFKCVRVEPQTSAPPSQGYAQQTDYLAAFCFEI